MPLPTLAPEPTPHPILVTLVQGPGVQWLDILPPRAQPLSEPMFGELRGKGAAKLGTSKQHSQPVNAQMRSGLFQ